jgi:hypothetical protein
LTVYVHVPFSFLLIFLLKVEPPLCGDESKVRFSRMLWPSFSPFTFFFSPVQYQKGSGHVEERPGGGNHCTGSKVHK